jgi:hypothetical protein
LPRVGNTVQGARFTNDIGQAVLAASWRNPDFDPGLRAFYYVRVLEIPTPTWLAYDKAFYGDKAKLPEDAKLVHQERAYTSPIWYTPKGWKVMVVWNNGAGGLRKRPSVRPAANPASSTTQRVKHDAATDFEMYGSPVPGHYVRNGCRCAESQLL